MTQQINLRLIRFISLVVIFIATSIFSFSGSAFAYKIHDGNACYAFYNGGSFMALWEYRNNAMSCVEGLVRPIGDEHEAITCKIEPMNENSINGNVTPRGILACEEP